MFRCGYKTLCVLSLAFLTSGVSCAKNNPFDAEIQYLIDQGRAIHEIPAVQVSILLPQETKPHQFVSGSVLLNQDLPLVTPKHLFQVGSQTKSFIAALILQLEAEGRLNIHDPINTWLPKLPVNWQKISIQQLLNHTSGIYNYTDALTQLIATQPDYDLNKQWTAEELIELASNQPNYFAAGSGWHYSNTNYVILGLIIKAVTGYSVQQELQTRFISPLNLSSTTYLSEQFDSPTLQQMAHGYSYLKLFANEPKDITTMNHSWLNAAGAIVSNAEDMALWFAELMHGHLLPSGQQNELMDLVNQYDGQPTSPTAHAEGYGLGIKHDFSSFQGESWWHSGGTLGYSSLMVWLPCCDIVLTMQVSNIADVAFEERDSYILANDLVSYLKTEQCRCQKIP